MSKTHIMEVMAPVPAPRAPRAQRYSAVSLAPAMSQPSSLTKQQVRSRSPLQSSVRVSAYFIFIYRDANFCYSGMLLWMEFIICLKLIKGDLQKWISKSPHPFSGLNIRWWGRWNHSVTCSHFHFFSEAPLCLLLWHLAGFLFWAQQAPRSVFLFSWNEKSRKYHF